MTYRLFGLERIHQKRSKMSLLCQYGELLPRNYPHILEKIFLFLDYESFKICFKVCTTWRELIISELLKRKAKDTFSLEIEEDGRKLTLAAREGRITIIRGLLSTRHLKATSRE